jgi:hypothetical protein
VAPSIYYETETDKQKQIKSLFLDSSTQQEFLKTKSLQKRLLDEQENNTKEAEELGV